jgi:hypothetical protein
MVKNLARYLGRTINVSYDAEGKNAFRSQLIRETDDTGNHKYYVRTPQGKKRIYANGKRRVVMYDGVLLMLDQNRMWTDLVRLMNEKDSQMGLNLSN